MDNLFVLSSARVQRWEETFFLIFGASAKTFYNAIYIYIYIHSILVDNNYLIIQLKFD
jgi:hypothetical protein